MFQEIVAMSFTTDAYLPEFHAALPPPLDNTPEASAARRQLAICHLDSLRAEGAQEIALAIQHVLCWWRALTALQLSHRVADDPAQVRRCQQQATALTRESRAALRLLHAAQRARGVRPMRSAMPLPESEPEPEQAPATTLSPPAGPAVAATAAAEDFARRFPNRAVRIRRAKGVPADINYDPPPPSVIAALVSGMTKPLRRLDRIPA
jgi:hypothetical protein